MQRKASSDKSYDNLSSKKEEDKDQGSRKGSRMNEPGKEKANSRKMLHFPIIKDSLQTIHWFKAVKRAKILNQRVARTNITSYPYEGLPFGFRRVPTSKNIRDLPWLQSISMSVGKSEFCIPGEVSTCLCNTLRQLPQLQNIEITFKQECFITDETMSYLSVSLRSLPRLQSLSIKFNKYEKKIDKGFIHLGKCLHYLKSIIISFPRESGRGIVSLCRSLKENVQLQNLELCFNGVELINEALTSLGSSLKRLSTLQTLSLEFEETCPSYETIQSLSDSLGYLKSLRTLRLHVGDNAETNQRFIVLCQGLKNLDLQKICLKPNSFQIKDIALEFLSEALIYQTSLQDITLPIMKGQDITNDGVEYLAEAIGNLVFLSTISLEFFRCKNVSDDGLISLSINLACLTLLQRFYLKFRSCGVTSEGVRYLSVCLRRLTGLKSIYLAFEYCDGITDDAIEFLNGVFRHFPSLEYLSLGFNGCQISDKGVSSLRDGLIFLTKLKQLDLNFVDCKMVTSEEKEKVKTKLKKLKQLRSSVKFTESSFYNPDPLEKIFKIIKTETTRLRPKKGTTRINIDLDLMM